MQFDRVYMTNSGLDLLTSVAAGTQKIEFTKAVASSHDYSGLSAGEFKALTGIANIEQSVKYARVIKENRTLVRAQVSFPSKDVTKAYKLYTVGFYAKGSNGNEILYGVMPSSLPDYIAAYDGHSNADDSFTMLTTVSDTANVSITVDQNSTPSFDDIRVATLNSSSYGINTSELALNDYPRFIAYGYLNGAGIAQTTSYAGVPEMVQLTMTVSLKNNGQTMLPRFWLAQLAKDLPDFDTSNFTTNRASDGKWMYLISEPATIGIQCLNATFK